MNLRGCGYLGPTGRAVGLRFGSCTAMGLHPSDSGSRADVAVLEERQDKADKTPGWSVVCGVLLCQSKGNPLKRWMGTGEVEGGEGNIEVFRARFENP